MCARVRVGAVQLSKSWVKSQSEPRSSMDSVVLVDYHATVVPCSKHFPAQQWYMPRASLAAAAGTSATTGCEVHVPLKRAPFCCDDILSEALAADFGAILPVLDPARDMAVGTLFAKDSGSW